LDTATCTEDGHTYTAIEFAALAPETLERLRRVLRCAECDGPAFFRKRSRSGRGACFGARPHADGCDQATADNDLLIPGAGDDQDELYNPGDRIVIDLGYGAQERQVHLDQDARQPRRARGGRFIGDGNRGNAEMHRRLSSMLRTLVTAPNFRFSDQIIAVGEHPELPARDFFVHFSDVTPQYSGQFRGYWGLLSDARRGVDNSLWLNSGGRTSMSVCLPEEYVDAISQRYRLTEDEDFSGAYLLVLATLSVSQYGKIFCVVNDPAVMSLR
jgi:hypothetical protein